MSKNKKYDVAVITALVVYVIKSLLQVGDGWVSRFNERHGTCQLIYNTNYNNTTVG